MTTTAAAWAGLIASVFTAGASADEVAAPAAPAATKWHGELRLHADGRARNPQGPLAAGNALQPGIAAPAADTLTAELGLQAQGRAGPLTLLGDAVAWQQRAEGGGVAGQGRINALNLSAERGGWAASAGKKVVGWDVGYGFRPNDVVQQEQRRTLYATPIEGRPLLEVEHFGADDAATLVWVNPQRWSDAPDASRGASESALAARLYHRSGALDAHLFGRWGRHTAGSAGAALAWVAGDALELHASWRVQARHDGWGPDAAATTGNPWRMATRGGAGQWLLGAQWTGERQQSLLVEAWHDGTALPDGDWSAWRGRNAGLIAAPPSIPTAARAGALAWQATPFDAPNLRQDNLFVRLAWQPEAWTLSLDALLHPADRGAMVTAALQWQGDRWRVSLALRQYAGAGDAVVRQLPQRRSAVAALALAF